MSDLISRQAAIDVFKNLIGIDCIFEEDPKVVGALIAVKEAITQLPAAEPERKKGKWEEKEVEASTAIDEWQSARCSVCGKYHTTPYVYYFDEFNYCPNCGAKMEEEK